MIDYNPDDAPIIRRNAIGDPEVNGEDIQDLRDYTERELQDLSRVIGVADDILTYFNLVSPQFTVAVLGASDVFYPWADTRAQYLSQVMVPQRLRVIPAGSANSFLDAATAPPTGPDFGGLSAVDYLIQYIRPQVAIVSLGLNDVYVNGRTQAEVTADANAVFSKLKGAGIATVFGYLQIHDSTHWPGATDVTKQHGVVPFFGGTSQNAADGAGYATSDATDLNVNLAATQQAQLNTWRSAASAISGLASVDFTLNYDMFKIARMGLMSCDRLHLNRTGAAMTASQTAKFLLTDAAFRARFPQFEAGIRAPGFLNVDDLFASALKAHPTITDAYVANSDNWFQGNNLNLFPQLITETVPTLDAGVRALSSWANNQKESFIFPARVNVANNTELVMIATGLFPNLTVETKFWRQTDTEPTAWTTSDIPVGADGVHAFIETIDTTERGDWFLKYRVGRDIIGRIPLTVT